MYGYPRAVLYVITASLFVAGIFSVGFSMGRDATGGDLGFGRSADRVDFGVVRDVYRQIREDSVEPPSAEALTRGAIRGMVRTLRAHDPYALFYSPEDYRYLKEIQTGKYQGIGIMLRQKDGLLVIASVLPDTPAQEEGLKRGDIIRSIDGVLVRQFNSDEAVDRIKGRPGTEVVLGIERDEKDLVFTLTRRELDLPNLKASVVEQDFGYVRLFGFSHGASEQLRDKVRTLLERGVQGIVLDLRGNPGGLFIEAVDVAGVFIENGAVVVYEARSEPQKVYEAEGNAFEDVPLVVLVNEATASASEIVAGALQDRERAILVGATTFGKGSVQRFVELRDDSAVKLTTATYTTPGGRNINGLGIEPNVEVARNQLRRALAILRGIVLSKSGGQG
ncbi:MAG TPA: S41 family peptidase [Actinomycetota bacterium]|nr:S41 family peptidase [Actinomycetota bacterium]